MQTVSSGRDLMTVAGLAGSLVIWSMTTSGATPLIAWRTVLASKTSAVENGYSQLADPIAASPGAGHACHLMA